MQELALNIDKMIRSKESRIAFKIIKNITIIHPTKRDGGIMNCFLNEKDEVIVDSNKILRSCIETIGKHSTKIVAPDITSIYFPRLPPLSIDAV